MSINKTKEDEFRTVVSEEEPLLGNGEKQKSWLDKNVRDKVLPSSRYIPSSSHTLPPQLTPENLRVLMFFALLVAFGMANNISGRWNQIKFGDRYAFFNNQVCMLRRGFPPVR